MSENSTPRPAAPSPDPRPHSSWTEHWEPSPTLVALRRLLDTGRQVTPAVARRAGLTQTELTLLEHVTEEPLGPSELAHRLGVTSAAASGIVDRLAARGHVERHPHPTDRRRTAIVPTPSGREELMGHLMPMFLALAQLDAEMTQDERAAVLRFLTAAQRAVGRLV